MEKLVFLQCTSRFFHKLLSVSPSHIEFCENSSSLLLSSDATERQTCETRVMKAKTPYSIVYSHLILMAWFNIDVFSISLDQTRLLCSLVVNTSLCLLMT